MFFIILSSFSKSLSPDPPHDSTIILLYWSENFEDDLPSFHKNLKSADLNL